MKMESRMDLKGTMVNNRQKIDSEEEEEDGKSRWWKHFIVLSCMAFAIHRELERREMLEELSVLRKEVPVEIREDRLRERVQDHSGEFQITSVLDFLVFMTDLDWIRNVQWPIAVHISFFLFVLTSLVIFIRKELHLLKTNRFMQQQADSVAIQVQTDIQQGSMSRQRLKKAIHDGLIFNLKEFALYRLDYRLSSWSSAKPMALFLATYLLIILGALVYYVVSGNEYSFSEAVWRSWTFVADSGTHADETGPNRLIALALTIGGMLIYSLMIGIIADGVSDLLDDLKKGKSRVIESGHTLVLGWSDKVIPTIRELAIANESEGGGVIVVLAERDKEAMEQDLSVFTPENLLGSIVVCRSGSPLILQNLLKVSAQTAKAIIVLSEPDVDPDESDARAVRTVMSLSGIHVKAHIVVEMCDIDNRELVLLVGKGNVEVLCAHDIIGRLMVQCARQPGLAGILEQLLGFEGDEFYLQEWPSLVGLTFLQASFRFDQAIPIGIKPADPIAAQMQLNDLAGDLVPLLQSPKSTGSSSKRESFEATKMNTHNKQAMSPSTDGSNNSDDGPTWTTHSPRNPENEEELLPPPPIGTTTKLHFSDTEDEDEFSLHRRGSDSTTESAKRATAAANTADLTIAAPTRTSSLFRPKQVTRQSRTDSINSSVFGEGPRTMILNPPNNYVIQPGDEILVIAEDDDTYEANENCCPSEEAKNALESVSSQHPRTSQRKPERLLFCGWRRDMDDLIAELDSLLSKGSELYLMSSVPVKTRMKRFKEAQKVDLENLENLTIHHIVGNPVLRRHLENLALEQFSSILILADEAFETNMQTADSRSLASLLLIRDIIQSRTEVGSSGSSSSVENTSDRNLLRHEQQENTSCSLEQQMSTSTSTTTTPPRDIRRSWCPRTHKRKRKEHHTIIISEILDSRTKSLIAIAEVSDYVMSNEIVACALSMVSEDRSINTVLTELLSSVGSEVQVRSCLEYCQAGEVLDFWTIMARARKCYEIAIGYKGKQDAKAVINPRDKSALRVWSEEDIVVVLATPSSNMF